MTDVNYFFDFHSTRVLTSSLSCAKDFRERVKVRDAIHTLALNRLEVTFTITDRPLFKTLDKHISFGLI